MRIIFKHTDKSSLFFSLLMLVSLCMKHFVSIKKTRIQFGDPYSAREVLGAFYYILIVIAVLLILLSFRKRNNQMLNIVAGILANIGLVIAVFGVSNGYKTLANIMTRTSRISFGVGLLILVIAFYSVMIRTAQFVENIYVRRLIPIFAWVVVAVLIFTGQLNNYSVMQEYLSAKAQFRANLVDHITLCLGVLVVTIFLGIPTGYLCNKYKKYDNFTMVLLSILETIPTLALFALIRIPLTYLKDTFPVLQKYGITGFGTAPAFAALLIYGLYLMVNNCRAAFQMVDSSLMEDAFAMGMTSSQVFRMIQLPMALPGIYNGIRITFIDTLVAASLASYVGGGGLGVYIVNGINQLSIDLQLLGVLPIFLLALISDFILKKIFDLLSPKKGATDDFVTARV